MPDPRPDVLDFLTTRRSRPAKTLGEPVPDRAALEPLLRIALRSPDHGKLEPWRLVVLERAALRRLADLVTVLGAEGERPPEEVDKQRLQYADAGLAVSVIFAPVASGKIPEEEQLLSAGAVCMQLLNAALAAGWGANWLTGWATKEARFREEGLGLRPDERIAGMIHIGTERVRPPERPRPEIGGKVAWMSE